MVGDLDFGDFEGLVGVEDGEIDGLSMVMELVTFFWGGVMVNTKWVS
jgi:hypothetical protein